MEGLFSSVQYSRIRRNQFKYLNKYHEEWTIYIVISGSFRCKINGVEDVLRKGDLYFIPPFVTFERSVLEPIFVHFIRFKTDDSKPLPIDIPWGRVTFEDLARLQSTLRIMADLSGNMQTDKSDLLGYLLYDILFQYRYEKDMRSCGDLQDPTVNSIIAYFESNYSQKLNMRDVASDFGLSPSGLIFKFRKATGILPMRSLIDIRIKNARHLLVDTSLPIAEIAEKTGFDNCYYFSTVFKKEVGISPSEYRKTYMI